MDGNLVKLINKQPTEIRELIASFHRRDWVNDHIKELKNKKKKMFLAETFRRKKLRNCTTVVEMLTIQYIHELYNVKIPLSPAGNYGFRYDEDFVYEYCEVAKKEIVPIDSDRNNRHIHELNKAYFDLMFEKLWRFLHRLAITYPEEDYSMTEIVNMLSKQFIKTYFLLEI